MLLDLAAGLAPFLDEECIPLLFRAIKPLVRNDASPQLQKRAYKVSKGKATLLNTRRLGSGRCIAHVLITVERRPCA